MVVIGGAIAFASLRSDEPSPVVSTQQTISPNPPDSQTLASQPENTPAQAPSAAGKYVKYADVDLAQISGEKVLFFHAPWCSQCRNIELGINAQGVPNDLTIIKVDYDSNQDLRKKYGITIQTTFVKVDDQGNLLSKYVAYDEPTFDAVKRNFL